MARSFSPGDIDEYGTIWGPVDNDGRQQGCSQGCVFVEKKRLSEYEAHGWKISEWVDHEGIITVSR